MTTQSRATIDAVYYLLLSRYAGSHIRSDNATQWKLKVMSIIYQYAPAWKRKLDIQDTLCNTDLEELLKADVSIHNMAANPDGTPINPDGSTVDTIIGGINNQATSYRKMGKMQGIAYLLQTLKNDYTQEFLDMFRKLFDVVSSPQRPLWYPEIGYQPEEVPFENYATNSFEEIFPTVDDFVSFYKTCGIPTTI